MKNKLVYLLLALTMCASLTACGGGDNTASTASSSTEDTVEDTVEDTTEDDTDGPTDEQIQALTEAYNQVATLYNDVVVTAQDNGWTDDQETVDALETIGAILNPVGEVLSGDVSALAGADFDALPDAVLELLPDLEALSEKVSVPYEGGAAGESSEGAATDEDLQVLIETYNELAPLFNDIYEAAETNGWLADEETVVELQALNEVLSVIGSGLTEDPSLLEGADINELTLQLQGELAPAIAELAKKVVEPYPEG